MEQFAAVTLTVEPAAVSRVKVGRREPPPRPIIATPAILRVRAVEEEIVSEWPGPTKMISPRLATQFEIASARVAKGARNVPRFPSAPPFWPFRRTVELFSQNT